LRVSGIKGTVARLRNPRDIRLGESVMVFGFPLAGSLTSRGNFTSGVVSGLLGLRDAVGAIQITAPVQPGNSGGPLMDASGLVIGVVQAKLDALRAAIATGDIPQNVNFAISLEVLASFLTENKVPFRDSAIAAPLETARVAELAQSFTYRVECRSTSKQAVAPRRAPKPPVLWSNNPLVEMRTNLGPIIVELYPDRAPVTVKNFLQYVQDGFYNGTIFHRVIDGFMIQGGGFTPDLIAKATRPSIPIESQNGLRNEVGTIAMARTRDPYSATSQFFINVVDNESLNYPTPDGHGYAVFGRVIKGMDVVDRIAKSPNGPKPPHMNVPIQPVLIENVRSIGAPPATGSR